MHMHHTVMWPALLYNIFPHYLINGDIFEKKVIEYKLCVLIFSTNLSETFLILRRSERDLIKNIYWSSCKVPIVLVRFQWNLNFLNGFSKNSHIKFHENPSNGNRVVPFGRKDGRTDRQTEVFRNIAKALKNLFHPTVLGGSHSRGNFLVLNLVQCQLVLKCTAWASTYESQRYCEAGGGICEACCVGLLLLKWLNEWVGE